MGKDNEYLWLKGVGSPDAFVLPDLRLNLFTKMFLVVPSTLLLHGIMIS